MLRHKMLFVQIINTEKMYYRMLNKDLIQKVILTEEG